MAKWLAKEFDWTLGQYTGNYYDIAEAGVVAVFVCSYTGNDTNAGTAAAPFKTISKAITTLNSTGANGSRIFMNGAFCETLPSQTYWYQFIGCGGGKNGRTVFFYVGTSVLATFNKNATIVENIETQDYNYQRIADTNNIYFIGCFLKFCDIYSVNTTTTWLYHCVAFDIINSWGYTTAVRAFSSIIYLYTKVGSSVNLYLINSYLKKGATLSVNVLSSVDSAIDINAEFIDPENFNFCVNPISPLLFAGTLDESNGFKKHIGDVVQGFSYEPITYSLTEDGGATITNLEISNGRLVRTDPNIAGSLETGSIDLGAPYPITQLTVEGIFEHDTTGVSKGVFEDLTGSPRPTLTILMKYGNTEAERDDCPWLEIEYGKRPTYSGSGASRIGNGDDTFDSDNELTITARYFKYKFTLQDR